MIDCTSLTASAQDRQLVGQRDAGVDVEHVAPAATWAWASLITAKNRRQPSRRPASCAGRVDALANDDKRQIMPNANLFCSRTATVSTPHAPFGLLLHADRWPALKFNNSATKDSKPQGHKEVWLLSFVP